MDDEDMCVYKENGIIKSLGWNINSSFLQNDMPLAACHQAGGGLGEGLQNLAIPMGLILLKNTIDSNTKKPMTELIDEPAVIGEDMYSKLLGLAGKTVRKTAGKTVRKTARKTARKTHITRKNKHQRKHKTKRKTRKNK